MSVRQFEEERQEREQFLKRENEALNRHKGELIEQKWALESENKRLRDENTKLAQIALKDTYDEFMAQREIKRLREGLEKIATRKMSCYLSTSHMNQDFIRIANEALGGETNE